MKQPKPSRSESEAPITADKTRRRKIAEERNSRRRENNEVDESEEYSSSSWTASNTIDIDEVLKTCAEVVSDQENMVLSVSAWLHGELVVEAKRGEDGEAILTRYDAPQPDPERVFTN